MKDVLPSLSVILPTIGRPSLPATLASIHCQLGPFDEVIVVSDGKNDETRRIIETADRRYIYVELPERTHDWGGMPRNVGIWRATKDYLTFMDDDDVYLPGAFDVIRKALLEKQGVPMIFRMWHCGRIIWDSPSIGIANVSSQMLVVPNVKGLVGYWTSRYAGDYDFIVDTVGRYDGDVVFREELIAELAKASFGK